jgi:hypothetical protein
MRCIKESTEVKGKWSYIENFHRSLSYCSIVYQLHSLHMVDVNIVIYITVNNIKLLIISIIHATCFGP